MRYVIRTVAGMALFAFSWVAVAYGIYQLLQVGTCASGGPYVVARECPDGIGWLALALTGGVLGLFIAALIYGGRGTPPGPARKPAGGAVVLWFWTGLFWSLAAGSLLGVWGPEASPGPGGKLGGLIVGFMGLVMGAGGLVAAGLSRSAAAATAGAPAAAGARPLGPALARVASTASRFSGAANPVDRIDTLDRLRRQGTITDAEFEALKSKIVKES